MRDRECVPSSFIVPGLSDQGAFSTWPGKGRVVVAVEKSAGFGHIFYWGAEGERGWKLLRLPVVRVGPGPGWGTEVKNVNGLQNFPLKALLILSSRSVDGERGKSLCGSVDLMKVKAKLPFDLDLNVNSNLLLVGARKCHQAKHEQMFEFSQLVICPSCLFPLA